LRFSLGLESICDKIGVIQSAMMEAAHTGATTLPKAKHERITFPAQSKSKRSFLMNKNGVAKALT